MIRPAALIRTMRRALLALVFAGALLARLASPPGWMPEVDASGFHLVPCDGTDTPPAMVGPAHHHHHHGKAGHGADHLCAFAGLGLAMAVPLSPPRPAAPAIERAVPHAIHAAVAVGRGLAAPPPPSTGPPLLA